MNNKLAQEYKELLASVGDAGAFNHITNRQLLELYRIIGDTALWGIFKLSSKERKVIEMHWRDGRSFDLIAENMQLTRERIRQIYSKGLLKIKFGVIVAIDAFKEYQLLRIKNETLEQENRELKLIIQETPAIKTITKDQIVIHQINLTEMEMSVRLFNALSSQQIRNIGDLIRWNKGSLLRIRNFGIASLSELQSLLKPFNVKLDTEKNKWFFEDNP